MRKDQEEEYRQLLAAAHNATKSKENFWYSVTNPEDAFEHPRSIEHQIEMDVLKTKAKMAWNLVKEFERKLGVAS